MSLLPVEDVVPPQVKEVRTLEAGRVVFAAWFMSSLLHRASDSTVGRDAGQGEAQRHGIL